MVIDIVKIRSDGDYLKLWEVIPEDFLSPDLMDFMRNSLSPTIRSVLIEYPYVDKDYRSTYYGFYSKRHREYSKFCFRLHFFEDDLESLDLPKVSSGYLGSMVLRPTEVTPLRELYYTCVLQSGNDGNFYVGFTKDLKLRPARLNNASH